MGIEMMKRADWLLALVGLPDRDCRVPDGMDRVRTQKALFVLGKVLSPSRKQFYDFRPYHYGPFDSTVYRDAEDLASRGLLVEATPPGGAYTSYVATPAGVEMARQVAQALTQEQRDYLRTVRQWVLAHDFNSLVKAIYEKWPETRVNSIFTG